jgi:hypothetical protein
MAWKIVYEGDSAGPQSFTESTDPRVLPTDGLQALVIDGQPIMGFEHVGFLDDGGIVTTKGTAEDLQAQFPNLVAVVRGKTTDTSRFHRIEVEAGRWSPQNLKPDAAEPNWHKRIIGWRLWTSNKVFDSVGVAEADWMAHWQSLPDTDVQVIKLYENWKVPDGEADYSQMVMGTDRFFMAPGPDAMIITGSDDLQSSIESRYPGAHVKAGRLIADNRFRSIVSEAIASRVL